MVVNLAFEKNQIPKHEIALIRQNDTQAGIEILEGEERSSVFEHIEELNGIISQDDALEKRFRERCKSQSNMTLSRLQPYSNRYLVAMNKRGLLPDVLSKNKRKLLTNLIRCESHREVLLSVLKDSLE
jgi:poly-gamma-glutamate synthesis protein (capsule biosynthesis protein)